MQTTQTHFLNALPNRLFFNATLNKALMQAERQNTMLALVLIDIDHFQKIKEAHGTAVSTSLLEELSQRFTSVLRASDTLAHLEDDEFAVLLTDLQQPKLAAAVAEKLLKISSLPFKIDSQEIRLTLSIAVCLFPEDGKTLEALQKHAADTLYQAKNQGGNKYQFTLPQRTTEAQDFLQLQSELRQALSKNEFVLYYQPKLDLKTDALQGVEALIRWKNATHGLIDPLQFIPSAEETSLILEIGRWALEEACRTNKAWQNEGYQPISVAVNLSPKQFYHPHLSKMIKTVLQETGLDPHYLELEITEMTVLNETPQIIQLIQKLKNLGLTLALDDFGTGHTSLTYLKKFPLDTVKIDQSFIKPLPEDSGNKAITTAIITVAHQLGMQVVAEGVETLEQLQLLRELQCDLVQGYFISPPLPASKIVAQLKKRSNP